MFFFPHLVNSVLLTWNLCFADKHMWHGCSFTYFISYSCILGNTGKTPLYCDKDNSSPLFMTDDVLFCASSCQRSIFRLVHLITTFVVVCLWIVYGFSVRWKNLNVKHKQAMQKEVIIKGL